MKYELYVNARLSREDAERQSSTLLAVGAKRRDSRVDDNTLFDWVLEPAGFHDAPRLRSLIVASRPRSWGERPRIIDDKDPLDASLVQLMTAALDGVKELGPAIDPEVRCVACGRPSPTWPENPAVRATFPEPLLVNGLFTAEKTFLSIMSTELLDKLRAAGLARGLETFPIDIESAHDQPYHGLYSNHRLMLAKPYGCVVAGDPCVACGSESAKHAFYPTYERPTDEVDWYYTSHGTKAWVVVTGRVYRWLRNEGRPWVGTPLSGHELEGIRRGWYPDEREQAFLPERFQGISDAPVEPITADELARLTGKPHKARARTSKGGSR